MVKATKPDWLNTPLINTLRQEPDCGEITETNRPESHQKGEKSQ
jgi:hypothetical protein